jgi:hypothetical protein
MDDENDVGDSYSILNSWNNSKGASDIRWLKLALSKGTNRVGVSHLKAETDPVSGTLCFVVILNFWRMNEVHKPCDS